MKAPLLHDVINDHDDNGSQIQGALYPSAITVLVPFRNYLILTLSYHHAFGSISIASTAPLLLPAQACCVITSSS